MFRHLGVSIDSSGHRPDAAIQVLEFAGRIRRRFADARDEIDELLFPGLHEHERLVEIALKAGRPLENESTVVERPLAPERYASLLCAARGRDEGRP